LLWTLAILCAAYLPLFFGQILFFRDIAHWNFPARAFLRDALVHGEFPGWNPYQGLGFAVFADPLYGVFYPPNWLFALVGPGWVASMLNWQCFLHMAWGAAGMCFLARRLGGSTPAMIIAGVEPPRRRARKHMPAAPQAICRKHCQLSMLATQPGPTRAKSQLGG